MASTRPRTPSTRRRSSRIVDASPRRLEQQIVGDDKTTAWLKVRVRRPREFTSLLRHRRDASRTVRFPHRISRRTIPIRPSPPVHEPNCRGSCHRRDVHPTHWLICAQVSFTVTALSGAKLDEAEKAPGGLLKKFKLESSMATSNMNFFDSGGVAIERYATPFDICKAFYKVRLETYAKRKAHLVKLKKGADPASSYATCLHPRPRRPSERAPEQGPIHPRGAVRGARRS